MLTQPRFITNKRFGRDNISKKYLLLIMGILFDKLFFIPYEFQILIKLLFGSFCCNSIVVSVQR